MGKTVKKVKDMKVDGRQNSKKDTSNKPFKRTSSKRIYRPGDSYTLDDIELL
jgi:hypothetical protein